MKTVTIGEMLNNRQISQAFQLYRQFGPGRELHKQLVEKIVLPNIGQINRSLGQENDPNYIAYAIEHVISLAGRR